MVVRTFVLAVLVIIASPVSTGRLLADQQPTEDREGAPQVQKKAGTGTMRFQKADDEAILVQLLMSDTVKKDLGLTPDQIREHTKLVEVSKADMKEFLAKGREILPRSLPQGELAAREQKFRALSEDFKRKGKELRTKALAILTPSQNERLKQIQLQKSILAALTRPEVVKILDLSQEQLAKLRVLGDEAQQKGLAEYPDLRGLNPHERRQKLIEYAKKSQPTRAEYAKRALDLLTSEQRTKFENLQGKKIDAATLEVELVPEESEFPETDR